MFALNEEYDPGDPGICGTWREDLSVASGSIQAQTVVLPLKLPASIAFGAARTPTFCDITNIAAFLISSAQISGTQITPGTLNTNAFDAASLAWLASLGSGGGSGGGITNFSLTATNLPSTNAPTAVVTGVTNNIAYVLLGIPAGAGNTNNYFTTNVVTAYNFTNAWLGCQQFTTYQTNYALWGTSNYLARLPGFSRGILGLGNDGGNPPTSIPGALLGSYNGSNGWFVINYQGFNTNGFTTTNWLTVVETNAPGVAEPGSAILYMVDHFELLGRTNYGFGEYYQFPTPVNPNDAATKSYADGLFANAFNNNWSSYSSNGFFHFVYSYQNSTLADFASQTIWIPIISGTLDSTGTNFLLAIYTTNLTAGYQIQSSTNLALVAGFTTWTNYTTSVAGAVTTFKSPLNLAEPMRFFRCIASSSSTAAVNVPLTVPFTICRSNSWTASYNAATNALTPGDWAFGLNSNGVSVWKMWNSNGTFYVNPMP